MILLLVVLLILLYGAGTVANVGGDLLWLLLVLALIGIVYQLYTGRRPL